MDLNLFVKNLQNQLKQPLPGEEAQLKMASVRRVQELLHYIPSHQEPISSSVLLLLYPVGNHLYFALIQRPSYNGVHGGQMAFPGGKREEGDRNLVDTALRETEEEIGVEVRMDHVLGSLTTLFIPPSNYHVTPYIAVVGEKPMFSPDSTEVAELVEISLQELMDDRNIKRRDIHIYGGFTINAPYYDLHGKVVWGATAMILSEFRELLIHIEGWK